jgi:hypothetical protein
MLVEGTGTVSKISFAIPESLAFVEGIRLEVATDVDASSSFWQRNTTEPFKYVMDVEVDGLLVWRHNLSSEYDHPTCTIPVYGAREIVLRATALDPSESVCRLLWILPRLVVRSPPVGRYLVLVPHSDEA